MVIKMKQELFYLLKQDRLKNEEQLKKISLKLNNLKRIYDIICPKGKKYKVEDIVELNKNEKLFNDIIYFIKQNGYAILGALLNNKIMYENFCLERDNMLSSIKLTKEMIFSDMNFNHLREKAKNDIEAKMLLENLTQMKEMEEKLGFLYIDTICYMFDYIIDYYEKLYEEKENIKSVIKNSKYSESILKNNGKLSASLIAYLNNLIYESNSEKKEELFSYLNDYIKSFNIRKIINEKQENIKKEYISVSYDEQLDDEDLYDEEKYFDKFISNITFSLMSFDSYSEIKTFLDTLKYNYDIEILISKILGCIKEDNIVLKNYLLDYLQLNIVEEKENTNTDNMIFFDGFFECNNKILEDIRVIPKEYYVDINKGLDDIKNKGINTSKKRICDLPKVMKLRINDIRIAYIRMDSNKYLILGIYLKKSAKGKDIIRSITKRYKNYLFNKEHILKAFSKEELINELIKSNSDIENEINKVIISKIKS